MENIKNILQKHLLWNSFNFRNRNDVEIKVIVTKCYNKCLTFWHGNVYNNFVSMLSKISFSKFSNLEKVSNLLLNSKNIITSYISKTVRVINTFDPGSIRHETLQLHYLLVFSRYMKFNYQSHCLPTLLRQLINVISNTHKLLPTNEKFTYFDASKRVCRLLMEPVEGSNCTNIAHPVAIKAQRSIVTYICMLA